MCGICGFVGFEDKGLLKRMASLQEHRGPDGKGFFYDAKVSLASQRLSIIDIAGGNQPIFNEDKSIAVVFNGEIFNFVELRALLEDSGHRFYTKTDTETIVHAYEEFGDSFFGKLRGQFAFALFDSGRTRVLLARDQFGIKPLFYSDYGDSFLFSSEIKPLTLAPQFDKSIDSDAMADYFTLGYVLSPKTIFSRIRSLLPGHFLEINVAEKTVGRGQFSNLASGPSKFGGEAESIARIPELLSRSVESQLVADTPVGVFLSGGVDSSAVTWAATQNADNLNTFSAGFEGDECELPNARLVASALGTKHHEILVGKKHLEDFPLLIARFGQPFYDDSAVPTNAVSGLAARHVKCVLAGDGGDELFAGYPNYDVLFSNKFRRLWGGASLTYNAFFRRILGKVSPGLNSRLYEYFRFHSHCPRDLHFYRKIQFDLGKNQFVYGVPRESYSTKKAVFAYGDSLPKREGLNRVLFQDLKTYLPDDLLVKVDRMSMNNSLEVRVPLLDEGFASHAMSIPFNLKHSGSRRKIIFRKALAGKLPETILFDKKTGFGFPELPWVSSFLDGQLGRFFFERDSTLENFFDMPVVRRMIANKQRMGGPQKWLFLSFAVWNKIFLENEKPSHVL